MPLKSKYTPPPEWPEENGKAFSPILEEYEAMPSSPDLCQVKQPIDYDKLHQSGSEGDKDCPPVVNHDEPANQNNHRDHDRLEGFRADDVW